jgi:hypothetical protein
MSDELAQPQADESAVRLQLLAEVREAEAEAHAGAAQRFDDVVPLLDAIRR